MNELEKMIQGEFYDSSDPLLVQMRTTAHGLCLEYNQLKETDSKRRNEILNELFPDHGKRLYLQGPIQMDYGSNVHFGQDVYANFNFTILDICPVTIGDNVFIGPNVSLYGALHPLDPNERRCYRNSDGRVTDKEYGKPIRIGSDTWIGGSVTILAGVSIGEGCVIGAGSVVTKDIPPHSLAFGNPARVQREIKPKDIQK